MAAVRLNNATEDANHFRIVSKSLVAAKGFFIGRYAGGTKVIKRYLHNMALTKQKKQEVIDEVSQLLADSKLTVVAKYQGTTVKQLQKLRKDAKAEGTNVKVVKNRLVVQAIKASDLYKEADTSALTSQLLYAFNSEDEVAPAKALADFAKKNPTIEFVGAYTTDGVFIGAEDVKALAALPSKAQLIAGIVNTLQSPVRDVMSGLGGNLHGLLQGLEAKAAK